MKLILIISALLTISHSGFSQDQEQPSRHFDGIYVGLNIGSQNVFGGSFVNNMDILAQENKFVSELAAGYRKQFISNRLVAGLEASFGLLNGNLEHYDPNEPLRINYKTSSQYSYGLQAGVVLGPARRFLLFGYLNETKRKFEVTINQPPYLYNQQDKQGMLKYGIGLEFQVAKRFHLEATFGGLSVDFGELETNIDVEDQYDTTLGLIYQF